MSNRYPPQIYINGTELIHCNFSIGLKYIGVSWSTSSDHRPGASQLATYENNTCLSVFPAPKNGRGGMPAQSTRCIAVHLQGLPHKWKAVSITCGNSQGTSFGVQPDLSSWGQSRATIP
jgi:hypothetical protein